MRGCPGCLVLRPGVCGPHWSCHPDAALKTLPLPSLRRGGAPLSRWLGAGRGSEEGLDARRTLAFLEGLGGSWFLSAWGAKRGCGGAERHRVAAEWGRKAHAGRRGRKTERETGLREAGLFRGRNTTPLRETAMESEEKGHGPPCHHWNL